MVLDVLVREGLIKRIGRGWQLVGDLRDICRTSGVSILLEMTQLL